MRTIVLRTKYQLFKKKNSQQNILWKLTFFFKCTFWRWPSSSSFLPSSASRSDLYFLLLFFFFSCDDALAPERSEFGQQQKKSSSSSSIQDTVKRLPPPPPPPPPKKISSLSLSCLHRMQRFEKVKRSFPKKTQHLSLYYLFHGNLNKTWIDYHQGCQDRKVKKMDQNKPKPDFCSAFINNFSKLNLASFLGERGLLRLKICQIDNSA